MTVRISATAVVVDDFGVELSGLVLSCLDEGDRMIIDAMTVPQDCSIFVLL
jgi:hypothetical protein